MVEGGRQTGSAGLLHRRGARAALAVSVSVAVRSNAHATASRPRTSGISGASGSPKELASVLVLVQLGQLRERLRRRPLPYRSGGQLVC